MKSGPDGTTATLIKYSPTGGRTVPQVNRVAAELSKLPVSQPIALHHQNQELLTLLGELRSNELELERSNLELEETNRGVLALYAELEDRAQTAENTAEMKTRFLSDVTHELRTPLNSMISFARILLLHTDGELSVEQGKQVQFILRSAQDLTAVVNDFLDLAKIEAGKISFNVCDFDLRDTLSALRGLFRPLATDARVRLTFDMPEDAILLSTDENKLAQILRNLISNAL